MSSRGPTGRDKLVVAKMDATSNDPDHQKVITARCYGHSRKLRLFYFSQSMYNSMLVREREREKDVVGGVKSFLFFVVVSVVYFFVPIGSLMVFGLLLVLLLCISFLFASLGKLEDVSCSGLREILV